jgi:hypothetical protein
MAQVLDEYNHKKDAEFDAKLKAYDEARAKAFDEKLALYTKDAEVNDEEVLRRYLGVNKDETLKMSDLPRLVGALRKASLETSEPGKKTPAATEKAGPDGSKPTNPIDQIFDNYGGTA